jgi:hypothetical protein
MAQTDLCGGRFRHVGRGVLDRGVAEQKEEEQGKPRAQDAEDFEGIRPAMPLRHPAAEAAEGAADHGARQQQAGGQGARGSSVVIHDEGHGGWHAGRLADAHQGPGQQQLLVGPGKGGQAGHHRPDKDTGDDHPAAAEPVGDVAGERTADRIDQEKDRRQQAELRLGHRDGLLDRPPHGGDHQPIEVVQAGRGHEQRHDPPGAEGSDGRGKGRAHGSDGMDVEGGNPAEDRFRAMLLPQGPARINPGQQDSSLDQSRRGASSWSNGFTSHGGLSGGGPPPERLPCSKSRLRRRSPSRRPSTPMSAHAPNAAADEPLTVTLGAEALRTFCRELLQSLGTPESPCPVCGGFPHRGQCARGGLARYSDAGDVHPADPRRGARRRRRGARGAGGRRLSALPWPERAGAGGLGSLHRPCAADRGPAGRGGGGGQSLQSLRRGCLVGRETGPGRIHRYCHEQRLPGGRALAGADADSRDQSALCRRAGARRCGSLVARHGDDHGGAGQGHPRGAPQSTDDSAFLGLSRFQRPAHDRHDRRPARGADSDRGLQGQRAGDDGRDLCARA